jgi:4-hydroxybenzoate polyprenyltransferase
MATVEYQLTKGELILTGTLRKLGRTRTLIGMALIFMAAVLLLFIGESYRILGWFLLAYVVLFPILVAPQRSNR